MTEPVSPLAKTFDFPDIESRWTHQWESTGAFRPHRPDAEPFTIVNPPPNVTGSLHIGHALDNTLQDILIRHARLQGKDALWVVGMDHAGIATQMVVERQLEARQDKRSNYTRDQFIDKVWEWKAESGGQITGQLRRLGCSMDWSREQFTMDPHFTKAVTKVFVDLYNQGLLYRDKRLVNWDPKFKTAISDLEVETVEVQGHMWHFKYPLAGGETYTYVERDAEGAITLSEERDYIAIATTRPETMLGDGAVAVHPGDERYRPIVGKLCEIPVGPKAQRRLIPIITDEYPDPDFGSGAVKITGAHDQNDYMVAQRNSIPMYRLMDEVAAMRADGPSYAVAAARAKEIAAGGSATNAEIDALNLVPDAYRGLDRYEARKAVVADIDADGLMLRVEDKTIMQPFGDRSGVVIEPMLTDQWYVDAKTLAGPPIEAVRSGAIEIVPKSWEKTFFNWMENIQPWCVSRQLWWGHRIPAWYGPTIIDGTPNYVVGEGPVSAPVFVADSFEDAAKLAGRFYEGSASEFIEAENPPLAYLATQGDAKRVALWRDQDVLDTWFSSALWPFATLGWPSSSPSTCDGEDILLQRHYPNDVLVSGFDILFFWDARMAMQGMHFMGEPPWKTLYLHGLVRAADGSKMSKSKGNTVDPLILMDKYGADALRFFMAAMESQGRDIKMDERRVEGYRNFATKLWNAARFCQSNGIGASKAVAAPEATLAVNKWIIGEVVETLAKLDKAFAEFRFDAMADAIYQFTWGTFCDWYLELIKPVLSSGNPPRSRGGGDGEAGDGGGDQEAPLPDTPLHRSAVPLPITGEDLDATETRLVAGWVLDQILVMLHPFMPFITEELWDKMGDRGDNLLIHAAWPEPGADVDAEAKAEVDWVRDLITQIRGIKSDLGVPPSKTVTAFVSKAEKRQYAWLYQNLLTIKRMGRLDMIQVRTPAGFATLPSEIDGLAIDPDMVADLASAGKVQLVAEGIVASLDFFGIIDLDAERARLTKSIEAISKDAASLAGRLSNPAFVDKAKPEAVEKARADHAEKAAEVERLSAALARLG